MWRHSCCELRSDDAWKQDCLRSYDTNVFHSFPIVPIQSPSFPTSSPSAVNLVETQVPSLANQVGISSSNPSAGVLVTSPDSSKPSVAINAEAETLMSSEAEAENSSTPSPTETSAGDAGNDEAHSSNNNTGGPPDTSKPMTEIDGEISSSAVGKPSPTSAAFDFESTFAIQTVALTVAVVLSSVGWS